VTHGARPTAASDGTHDALKGAPDASRIPFRDLCRHVVLCSPEYTNSHTGEGKDMTYNRPTLKRLGSLAELTLTNASCDNNHDKSW
jgi:hypothetical protein